MAATETVAKAKATPTDAVLLTLEDREMPLAELVAKVGDKVAASAWARGEIELGRRVRVVTGNPKLKLSREGESPAGLMIEEPVEWSGPKTGRQKSLAAILAEELPECPRYRRYEKAVNDQGEEYRKPVVIRRDEAVKLCEYRVRLTDKGLAALSPE